MRRVQDIKDLEGKKVLVRVDYNVPVKDGKVTNTGRIEASLDTINYLVSKSASVVLISHLGRPEGKVNNEFSLKPVAEVLEKMNKNFVQFIPDCIGEKKEKALKSLMPGEIILLENLRFYEQEEANEKEFARALAEGFDYFVNDAFSAAHRAHASIVGVTEYLPGYAGFAFQEEVDNLTEILKKPQRPFVFIGGGAKISDKLPILKNLMSKVDIMLIGGGMANTFLCAQEMEIGCSLSEKDCIPDAKEIIAEADKKGVAFLLPEDAVVTKKVEVNPKAEEKDIEDIEAEEIIADLGVNTIEEFNNVLKEAGTVFWNGPLGIAEIPEFANATLEIGRAVADSDAFSVIGGGDTIATLPHELKERFDFVSMAGGASMEFLEGKILPGIKALED